SGRWSRNGRARKVSFFPGAAQATSTFVRATNVEDREYFRPPYRGRRVFFLSAPCEKFSLTAFACGFYQWYEDAPTPVAAELWTHRLHRPDRGSPRLVPFRMPIRFRRVCPRIPRGSRGARRFHNSTAVPIRA